MWKKYIRVLHIHTLRTIPYAISDNYILKYIDSGISRRLIELLKLKEKWVPWAHWGQTMLKRIYWGLQYLLKYKRKTELKRGYWASRARNGLLDFQHLNFNQNIVSCSDIYSRARLKSMFKAKKNTLKNDYTRSRMSLLDPNEITRIVLGNVVENETTRLHSFKVIYTKTKLTYKILLNNWLFSLFLPWKKERDNNKNWIINF